MRLRKAAAATLLLGLALSLTAPAAGAAAPTPLYLNGKLLNLPQPPVIVNNRMLVPVRAYMEALGAEVSWLPPNTVTVQWEDRTLSLEIGDSKVRAGREVIAMDVPAQLVNGSTYVPVRFLSEGLGATVTYDGKAVHVTSPVTTRVVVDGPLNVRAGASLTAPVLMTVPVGTRFGVIEPGAEWSKVALPGGATGWVASRYLAPLPKRPPFDPFAEMLAGPTGYLQVGARCLGAAPMFGSALYAPLAPTVAALGGQVVGGKVELQGRTWTPPQSEVRVVGGVTLLPARTLADALGLKLTWSDGRRVALLELPGSAAPAPDACNPASPAAAYVIMDVRSGLVLSEQQADQTRPVASITKIMTGLLAVERGHLDEMVTTSAYGASMIGTSMNLRAGDRVRLADMLYGLMLPSGNDAAAAIAEHLSGTEANFARAMTQRAAELGAVNTLFLNASGLDDWYTPYSTARDMALIAREAMQQPRFRDVVSRKEYWFDGPRGPWQVKNRNEFALTYPGATGVKNGWTEKADHTLVASAYQNGKEVLVVILGARSREQLYSEASRLMNHGFWLADTAWLLNR